MEYFEKQFRDKRELSYSVCKELLVCLVRS